MQVKKQRLELDMGQLTGSKLGKEYIKAVYCHPAYLTYMQISQEADNVFWNSHLFQNLLQFIVIHTVKGFGIDNKAEIDVFLEHVSLAFLSSGCWQFDLWFLCLF